MRNKFAQAAASAAAAAAAAAVQRNPVKLGDRLFYEDDKVISVCRLQEDAGVVDADCVAFGDRLAKGEFKRLEELNLVSFCFCCIFGACFVALRGVV